jgi:transcriptional regulator with XRE-family HTH domain
MTGEEVKRRLSEAGFKLKDVTDKLGISSALIQGWLNVQDMKVGTLEKIAGAIGKDIGFFFPDLYNSKVKPVTDFINIPVVHTRAMAGYLRGYGDAEYVESLPTVPVMVDKAYHGKYICFECSGDSMDDGSRNSICDRDIVLARDIKRELWQSKLHYKDWYFIIVHLNGIAIKQITHQDLERGIITLHSLNSLYEDFNVNLDEVLELYNVVKIVDRSVRL